MGVLTKYEAIAVVVFSGRVDNYGQSHGHYTCDVKEKECNAWFRTNDSTDPVSIEVEDVSKIPYVVLYKRISS